MTRERRAWSAGIVFVVFLLAETAISAGLPINQDDSAAKIAGALRDHRDIVLIAAYLSAVYAVAFVVYLAKLHDLLRGAAPRARVLHSLVLVGGVLMVALHAVSDIGIYGLLGGKLATYGDQGLAYTLYLLTFALDSVGDVFGSVFLIAAGVLVIQSRVLPSWLAWIALVSGTLLFLQGFGLGGVIGTYGLVLDLIGFVLFLLFVLLSSAISIRNERPARATEARSA
jgi:membrane-associated HD superfamily phosphohydrolase